MPEPAKPKNLVITVAAGYCEEQIRPFLESLAYYCPDVSLRLIVDRVRPEFKSALRAWIPDCSFYLLPPAELRNFALRHKLARSILKRLTKFLPPPNVGKRLLRINFVRHIVIRDLLKSWNLQNEKLLLVDSRDLVFQGDPFAGDWPELWTGEEAVRIQDCPLNSFWLKRAGGQDALQKTCHHRIVCAGVFGGNAGRIAQYIDRTSALVERLACQVALDAGDQGIHNYFVRSVPELGFTVLPNGCARVANVGNTQPREITIEAGRMRLTDRQEFPAILHQFDRHPNLKEMVASRWPTAKPV